ncbi:MAG: hypothetical protein IT539_15030 [Bradyrhizobiaceae bacterium]|nr:hypothetical protein [Bradyrhizobiaceae bacterium]
MHSVAAWQRGYGLRRWLAPVLVLVFALSGLTHAAAGEHAVSAAAHSHEIVTVDHDSGAPCDPEHDGEPHDMNCGTTGACPFCAPLTWPAFLVPPSAELAAIPREAAHLSRILSPHLRPPEFLPNA